MDSKKKAVVLFGGQSSEHEVSCVSAATIIKCINSEKYDVILIGITKEGHWIKTNSVEDIESGEWRKGDVNAIISPDASDKAVIFIKNGMTEKVNIDIVFPVLHGLYGEDGTVQGIFELAKIPYVGCGVLASAVSMDKFYTKIIVEHIGGIRQAAFEPVYTKEFENMSDIISRVEKRFKYPVFIKPSNAGSSRGVTKAHNQEELTEGLKKASMHDKKILVEETICGRELECAVFGGKDIFASDVGEVLAGAEFYDYDAKYNSSDSETVISPKLPDGKTEEIKNAAVRIFEAVGGYGLARVDFFLEDKTNEVIFNEINTMPGFTSISMYPMLLDAKGINKEKLVDNLMELAFKRF